MSWCLGWEEDGGVREQTWRGSGARGGRGSRGLGLACAPCSAIRTPPRLHGALTQSPAPGHVLARRQLIGLSKKPTGWGAAILQREALGVQGHTLSRAQVASSWRLTLVCGPCLALLPFVWPWGACGQEKPCTHPQLHGRTPGQAPGLPWRTAVFGAAAVPVSEVQPAPRPPRPPSAPGKLSDSEQLSLCRRWPSAGPGTTARASDGRARPRGHPAPSVSSLCLLCSLFSLCPGELLVPSSPRRAVQ